MSNSQTSGPRALTVHFFHDVVCGWCYVMSPRLRRLAEELNLDVRHHTFVLQDSRDRMVQVFGSMPQAKQEILGHWESCARYEDHPRINIAGMKAQTFEYPNGWQAALACQAAHTLGGDAAHWDYFDGAQFAHLTENRNIGDVAVLLDIAVELGFDHETFKATMAAGTTHAQVRADRKQAYDLGIQSIPTLIVGDDRMRLQTTPLDLLRERLQECIDRQRVFSPE